jgi:tetratricopeptide (TPR) repeat protein
MFKSDCIKMVCFVWIVLASVNAEAQNDSILIKLKNHPQKDSLRVELLVDACVNAAFSADSSVLIMALEAQAISNKIGYELGKIRALNSIGNYYYQRSLYVQAINHYLKALKLSENRNDIDNIIIGKSNLANVYNRLNKTTESIQLLKECNNLLLNKGDSLTQKRAAILTNLATAFASIKMHDTAALYYETVYEICTLKDITIGIAITLSNLGSEYYELQRYNQAIQVLEKAEVLVNKMDYDFLRASVNKSLGKNFIAINQKAKGIKFLQKAVSIARENKDANNAIESYEFLYKVYANQKDYYNAYTNAVLYHSLKDSIYNLEKDKTIFELNTQYQTEKKEQTISLLKKDNQVKALQNEQKNYLIVGIVGLLLIGSFSGFLFFTRYRVQQQNTLLAAKVSAVEFEKDKTRMELTALKSQMNPHFIFNALNSIQEFIILNDKKKANQFMGKYADLVRSTLQMSDKESITLDEEVKSLELYLELEKLRFEDNFNYRINIAEALQERNDRLPAMLIQPYVENAIKHGLLHQQGNKTVTIDFQIELNNPSIIKCIIEDNGIGRARSAELNAMRIKKHTSFSTGATQKRLQLLNKGKDNAIVVTFEDLNDHLGQANGTRVTLRITTIQSDYSA